MTARHPAPDPPPTFRCLDFTWSFRTADPELGREVRDLYAPCRTSSAGAQPVEFEATVRPTGAVDLTRDREPVLQDASRGLAVAHLVWEVNRGVVATPGPTLLLHAAAAAAGDGAAVVLAGPSGSGKSTLVAALVRSGLHYLTDEATALPLGEGSIRAYPKPIALGRGGGAALGLTGPTVRTGIVATSEGFLVPAGALGPAGPGPAAPVPRLVVLPRFAAGTHVSVVPVHPAEAALELARGAFNFRTVGPGRLPTLAGAVSSCACVRIEFGELGKACDAIRGRLADVSSPGRGP